MEDEETCGPVSKPEKVNFINKETSNDNIIENVTPNRGDLIIEAYEENIDSQETINQLNLGDEGGRKEKEIEEVLDSDMVEILVFDSAVTTPEKSSIPEKEDFESKIVEDIEIVDSEINDLEKETTAKEPSEKSVQETALEALEDRDPLELQSDCEKKQDNNADKSVIDPDSECPEIEDNNPRNSLKRELQSLLNSAKNSKILSEFTQNTSKIRKSRKYLDNSAASNVSAELEKTAEKLVRSRRSSINSNLSNSSFNSDKEIKRSMRSQNPNFLVKQRRFLNLVVGRKQEMEFVDISSSDESNDEADSAANLNLTNEKKTTPDCSLQTSPIQEDTLGKMFRGPSDPYCWRCHREVTTATANPGSASHCSTCVRSYHVKCLGTLSNGVAKQVSDMWTCPECLAIQNAENLETRSPAMKKVTLPVMCDLLRYALKRLMDLPGVEPFTHGVDLSRFPEYPRFVVRPMDLVKMKRNVASSEYASTQSFLADAKFILHNSIVFNTQQSRLTMLAKSLVRTAKLEMSEIEACPQCYSAANTRQSTWFTDVCDPPHMLLWAKLKGFPYWPAKAMSVNASSASVDARFFGAHDRAWVQLKDCYLYSSKDPNIIVRNKRQDINESVREAEHHIRNITRKFGVFVHAPFKTLYEPARHQEQLRMMIPSYQGTITVQPVNKESELKSLRPYPAIPRRNSLPAFDTRSPKTPRSGASSIIGYGTDDDDKESKDRKKSRRMADGANITPEDEIVHLDSPLKDCSMSSNDSLRTSTPKGVTRKRSHNELQEANEFSIFQAKKYKTQLKNCSVRIEILEESDEECKKRGIKSFRRMDASRIEKKSEANESKIDNDLEMKKMDVEEGPIKQSDEQTEEYDKTERQKATENTVQAKNIDETKTLDRSKDIKLSNNDVHPENGTKETYVADKTVESPQRVVKETNIQTDKLTVASYDNQMPKITSVLSLADQDVEYVCFEANTMQESCEVSTDRPKSMNPKSPCSNTMKPKSPTLNTMESTNHQKLVNTIIRQKSSISNTIKRTSPVTPQSHPSPQHNPASNAMRQSPNSSNSLTNSNVFKVTKPKEPIVANMKEAMERLKQLREEVASERVNRKVGTIEVRSFARTGIDNPPLNSLGKVVKNTQRTPEEKLVSQPQNVTSIDQTKSPGSSNLVEVEIKSEPIDGELTNEQRTVEKNNLLGSLQLKPTSNAQNNTISRTPDVRTMSNYKIPVTIIRKETNASKPKPRTRKPAPKAITNAKVASSSIGANLCVNTTTTSSGGKFGSQFPMVYIPPSAMADLAKQNSQKIVSKSNVSTNFGLGTILDSDYVMHTVNSTNQNSFAISTNVNNIGSATSATNSVTVSSANVPLLCAGVDQTGTQGATQQMPSVLQGLVSGGQPYSIQAIPIATTVNNGLTPVILSFQQTPSIRPTNTNLPPLVDINNGNDSSTDSANSILNQSHNSLNMMNQGLNIQGLNNLGQPWGSGSTIAVNVATAGSKLVVNGPLPDLTSMDPQSAATLTQGLAAALSNVLGKQVPSVQTQPSFSGNPLDTSNPPYPQVSSTGQIHKLLNEQSVKLADHFRRALEECLSSLSSLGSPEATIRSLQLQLEKSEARHKDQITQLKYSTEAMLSDANKNFQKDLQHVRRECRTNADTERVIAVNEAKKKQWCANCWREAQFYCCWNTSYCNYPCQQAHWPAHFASCTQDNDSGSGTSTGTGFSTANEESGAVRKPTPQIQFIRRIGVQQDHSTENGISGPQTFTVQKRLVARSYPPRRPNAPVLTVSQGSVCQPRPGTPDDHKEENSTTNLKKKKKTYAEYQKEYRQRLKEKHTPTQTQRSDEQKLRRAANSKAYRERKKRLREEGGLTKRYSTQQSSVLQSQRQSPFETVALIHKARTPGPNEIEQFGQVSSGVMRLTPAPVRYSQPYFLNKLQVNSESDTNRTTQPQSHIIQKVAPLSKPTTPRPFTPSISTANTSA